MLKKIQAGGGVVINEQNQILFIYRRKKWDLPKGKLDLGEDIKACAVREVMEETGLENITLGEHILTTTHQYEEKGESILKETHWFKMKINTNENPHVIPQTEEDIEEIKWVSQEELHYFLDHSYPTIRDVLACLYGTSNHIG